MDEPVIVVALSKKLLSMLDTGRLKPFNNRLDLVWDYFYLTFTNIVAKKLDFRLGKGIFRLLNK